MVYNAEALHPNSVSRDNLRTANIEVTSSTARVLEVFTSSSEGRAAVVTSSRDVQRLPITDELTTIFIVHGPVDSTDNGLRALEEIQRNSDFSQVRVVLVSEYQLNPQTIGMYADKGATDVIEAKDIDPSALQDYINGKTSQLSSAA